MQYQLLIYIRGKLDITQCLQPVAVVYICRMPYSKLLALLTVNAAQSTSPKSGCVAVELILPQNDEI